VLLTVGMLLTEGHKQVTSGVREECSQKLLLICNIIEFNRVSFRNSSIQLWSWVGDKFAVVILLILGASYQIPIRATTLYAPEFSAQQSYGVRGSPQELTIAMLSPDPSFSVNVR
jgi:hypothetical protein